MANITGKVTDSMSETMSLFYLLRHLLNSVNEVNSVYIHVAGTDNLVI